MIYERNIRDNVLESLEDAPIVLLVGARQIGKSTLILEELSKKIPLDYVTLDDTDVLYSLQGDPKSFLLQYQKLLVLDEIQRAPDCFITLKKIVDERKECGAYLLTGSTNILTLPKLSESLAGRMIIYPMWPLSQGELRGRCETFIQRIFEEHFPKISENTLENPSDEEWSQWIAVGGYPGSLNAKTAKKRFTWFRSYVETILQRDIKSLSDIEGLRNIPNILSILAARVGNFVNISDIGRIAGIKTSTIQRYYTLLKMVFLVVEVPAWFTNNEKRLIKSPKVYLNDTGLLCHLLNYDADALKQDKNFEGHAFENFIAMEIMKQISWSDIPVKLYYFRTQSGDEVDFVLEGPQGKIIGIEVKSRRTCSPSDIKGLQALKKTAGERFLKGILLYKGDKTVFLDEGIVAIPASSLWGE